VSWARGRAAAEAFRVERELGAGPLDIFRVVDDLPDLLAAYGQFEAADGVYIKTPSTAVMVVNVDRPAVRQRFTTAHELGHHVLHGQAVGELTIEDPDVYVMAKGPREQEADAFAAYLLAPDDGLQALVAQRQVTPAVVAQVVAKFGVAWPTAVYRLHNAHLIVAKERDALCQIPGNFQWQQITRAGGPLPGHEPGLPRQLVDVVLDLYRRSLLTEEKTAFILETTPQELRALAHFEPPSEPPIFDAEAADELFRQLM
jgi:Zn-dependent peptidase ImmA (M78 family)